MQAHRRNSSANCRCRMGCGAHRQCAKGKSMRRLIGNLAGRRTKSAPEAHGGALELQFVA
jgi:hypothetical protein